MRPWPEGQGDWKAYSIQENAMLYAFRYQHGFISFELLERGKLVDGSGY